MTRYHRHQHLKKRRVLIVAKKVQPLLVDRLTFIAAILEPLFTIPQVFTIFRFHDASGVSISTWAGYDLLTAVWLWYGVTHKEKIILLYQGLFFVFQSIVIVGSLMYGARW